MAFRVFSLYLIIASIIPCVTFAQGSPAIEQAATYVSELDRSLTLRRVGLLPVTDNIDGIYARPIEGKLIELMKASHRWDYVETKVVGQVLTPADLESDPEQVKRLSDGSADALLSVRASRGPNGVTLTFDLFLTGDGKLLLQEVVKDFPQFDTKELLLKVESMYQKLLSKMPYSGIVLSRQGNRVTINLGKSDGISPNTVVTSVLIISVNRHPKFNFVISTEREVLGKIKIEKVDEAISFGIVVSEKARGAIEKNSKIAGLDFVKYDETQSFTGIQEAGLDPNDDANKVAFGQGAQEWIPVAPPTFGKVGLLLGLGSYVYNMNLESSGALKGNSSLYPNIRVDGEIWVTPEWNIVTLIRQGILSVTNPLSGSTPTDLSISLSRYSLYVARNFLLKGDFFGPKIQVLGGFTRYNAFVDASSPVGLTSMTYSGLSLGLRGELPITEDETWTVGAGLEVFLSTSMSESPVSSGATSKNTVNSFSFFGSKKLSERLRGVGSIDFEQYSTTFSGDGTRTERDLTLLSEQQYLWVASTTSFDEVSVKEYPVLSSGRSLGAIS